MEYLITCLGCPDALGKFFKDDRPELSAVSMEGDAVSIAEALARAAVSSLPMYVASRSIGHGLTEDERAYLVTNTLFDIYSDTDRLGEIRAEIASVYHSLLKEHRRLDLLGALRFRLPHILREWKAAAVYHKEKLRTGEELSEILDFLSLYAQTVASDIPYVRILPFKGSYLLLTKEGDIIDAMPPTLPEFEGMAEEDILLSRLINISPGSIDARDVFDPQLKLLLKRIFNGRMLF